MRYGFPARVVNSVVPSGFRRTGPVVVVFQFVVSGITVENLLRRRAEIFGEHTIAIGKKYV